MVIFRNSAAENGHKSAGKNKRLLIYESELSSKRNMCLNNLTAVKNEARKCIHVIKVHVHERDLKMQ